MYRRKTLEMELCREVCVGTCTLMHISVLGSKTASANDLCCCPFPGSFSSVPDGITYYIHTRMSSNRILGVFSSSGGGAQSLQWRGCGRVPEANGSRRSSCSAIGGKDDGTLREAKRWSASWRRFRCFCDPRTLSALPFLLLPLRIYAIFFFSFINFFPGVSTHIVSSSLLNF